LRGVYRTLNLGWRLSCALALAAICGPATAFAQAPAKDALTFPASLEPGVLADWLRHDTDIPPAAVVAVSPLAVVAIMQTKPMASPEGFEVTLQAETVDAGFSRQEGLASWNATMKLACKDRTFSMGEVTAHTARNLKGDSRPIQTALTGWNPVTPGTMQGQIWNARCGGDFKAPLADSPRPAAAAPMTAAPAPASPPAASPPPAATPATPAPIPNPSPAPPAIPRPTPAPKPTPAAKPPAAKPAASGRPSSAQILSAPTSDEAARALAKLKSRLSGEMAGLSTSVVPVLTDGKTRYRAIVSGFQSPGDAGRFCEKVTAAGGKCLQRSDAGRAASEKAP
jgi:hypothetical protein